MMTTPPDPDPRRERVLVLAPTGRDAESVRAVLGEAGIAAEPCPDAPALCRRIAEGAGAVLIAEEALSPEAIAALEEVLGEQEPWSDLPIVLVTGRGEHHEARRRVLRLLGAASNPTILERPFRKLTLATAIEAALRARRRQYQMREATADLVRAAEERAQAEALRQEGALRERFVGVLAHDLRSPLQAVAFSADRLAKFDLPREKVRESGERILRASERMARLVHDLLDFTRSRQSGGIPIAPRPADLAVIVRRTIDEIQAAHPYKRVELESRGDTRGAWDADRLAQVVSNLCVNSVTYSPPDTAVSVALRGEDGEVVLAVRNQGDPIPEETLARIFDPFKRGDGKGAGRAGGQGLGLGLFIAERIVRAHGGAIQATSRAGEGTTFTVRLPRRPASAPAGTAEPGAETARAGEPPEPAPEAEGPCHPGHFVLVVEDDETIRLILREVLEDEGYRVVTAQNGREALEILSSGARPCVILLDLMMPVMNGWQLLEALHQRGDLARLPVVVVSAATGVCELPAGARRCLPKPIHLGNLLAAIAESCP
jgi:signal transduction histidine kinase/CheY-like chemotaxis protein